MTSWAIQNLLREEPEQSASRYFRWAQQSLDDSSRPNFGQSITEPSSQGGDGHFRTPSLGYEGSSVQDLSPLLNYMSRNASGHSSQSAYARPHSCDVDHSSFAGYGIEESQRDIIRARLPSLEYWPDRPRESSTQEQLAFLVKRFRDFDNNFNKQRDIRARQPNYTVEQFQGLTASHRTFLQKHHDFFLASQHPSPSSASNLIRPKRRRLELPITINGLTFASVADTGAAENIVDEATARRLKAPIHRGPEGLKSFVLANGKVVQSIGCFKARVSFVKGAPTTTECVFYVLRKCAAPLIMGRGFLERTKTMTVGLKHRFQERTATVRHPFRVCYIGGTSSRLSCKVDGSNVLVNPDSGSEINVMSLNYARRHGYYRKRSNRQLEIILGDGSKDKTLGEVTATVILGGHTYLEEFHILSGLPSDILLGEEILDETDAFSFYENDFLDFDAGLEGEELSPIRVLNFIERMVRHQQAIPSADKTLFHKDRAERHRHDHETRRIHGLPPFERQSEWEKEQEKVEEYKLSRYRELVNRLQATDFEERHRRNAAQQNISALIARHRPPAITYEESLIREYDKSRQERVEVLRRSPSHPLYPVIPPWP